MGTAGQGCFEGSHLEHWVAVRDKRRRNRSGIASSWAAALRRKHRELLGREAERVQGKHEQHRCSGVFLP